VNGTPVDYQLLTIFRAVAEQSSFTKAARKLGIGKGTVSRAVARLEGILGVELIHRTTHDVALSTAGNALYERTAHHLAALDQAVLDLPERAAEPSGTLRLTAPHDFGAILLPELLTLFARRYPEVRFDVRITNSRVDLVAEGFDLAIRPYVGSSSKDSGLIMRRLGGPLTGELYASLSYLARRGKPKRLGDPKHEWILFPAALPLFKFPRDSTRFLCDDLFVTRELVRDGAGIGFLPRFLADAYVRDGLIEPVLVGGLPSTKASYVVVYPSSGQTPRKVTAFCDILVERFKKSTLL
jgi:DNA-binding transcriptional LysR family regulator